MPPAFPLLAVLGCAAVLPQKAAPPPSAASAPCARPVPALETALVLEGAPDSRALRALESHPGGPASLLAPGALAYGHVAALALAAGGAVETLEVVLVTAEGQQVSLPLVLGELTGTPWDGALPQLSYPAPAPEWPVPGSRHEAAAVGEAVTIQLDADQAWVTLGSQRIASSPAALADAVGALSGVAEAPVCVLDATARTAWADVVLALSALACSGAYGDQQPATVILGR